MPLNGGASLNRIRYLCIRMNKSSGSDIRVVIIEDDDTIREGYAYLIGNEEGLSIMGAYPSVEEAVKQLPNDDPHVLLLDVQLPGIRGVDALPTIKKLIPDVQVLILTVYESEEIIFTALKNGAAGYLTKNLPAEKIIESIREAVHGGGPMSPGIAALVIRSFQKNNNSPLSKRETQILESISSGKSRSKIAAELFIDTETVKTHIRNIYYKLNVNSREEALKVARDSKYI